MNRFDFCKGVHYNYISVSEVEPKYLKTTSIVYYRILPKIFWSDNGLKQQKSINSLVGSFYELVFLK